MSKKITPKSKKVVTEGVKLYTMDVCLISGPIDEKFIKRSPQICRAIEIRGDQTLEDFHNIIFDAFNREEEHMYEFQIGGKGPNDPKARRYILSEESDGPLEISKATGVVSEATIGLLNLKVGESFGYWFDFGDDWWHQITVVSIKDEIRGRKYPKIIKRIGKSPPQYPDFE
jgi:hypothetical protein